MGKGRICAMLGCTPGKSTVRKYSTYPRRSGLEKAGLHLCLRRDNVNFACTVFCELHFSVKQIKMNLKYELSPLPSSYRELTDDAIPDHHLPEVLGLPSHEEEQPAGATASDCDPT